MKQHKIVGYTRHEEWTWDDDFEEEILDIWSTPIHRKTAWGWAVWLGREFLYRTHLRRRPTTFALLNAAMKNIYLPSITESIFQESPLLHRLCADAKRRANS